MKIMIEYIQHHPIIALVVTVTHVIFAEYLTTVQIPNIIMQLAQLGAWCVTISVGLITIHGAFKKKKK